MFGADVYYLIYSEIASIVSTFGVLCVQIVYCFFNFYAICTILHQQNEPDLVKERRFIARFLDIYVVLGLKSLISAPFSVVYLEYRPGFLSITILITLERDMVLMLLQASPEGSR